MKKRKTRNLLKKSKKDKGTPPLFKLIGNFKVKDKVLICCTNQGVKTAPHRRYHGKIGSVCLIEGKGYKVRVPVSKTTNKYIYTTYENLKYLK